MQKIIIFGAGIAGLSAAHELARLGYNVAVYEVNDQAGGFFRSSRLSHNNMPTEYSWHGMGPWYHNTFDIMQQIPFNEQGTIYDLALSRSIAFGIFPDKAKAQFYDEGLKSIHKMFRMDKWDFTKSTYLMLKSWTANKRSQMTYARLNAAEAWQPLMSEVAYKTWRSCFGPWIGSDWSKVSLHITGDFFRKQLITQPTHEHKADHDGPAWSQGAGDGWLLLKGPSSEYWFDPWVRHLQEQGVQFCWGKGLSRLEFDGSRISAAYCGNEQIVGDIYLLAINPFMTAEILSVTPELERQEELRLFKPLTQDGPHAQVSFRLAFAEAIKFPRQRTAVVVSDSEFNLTLFAQEQVWDQTVDLGHNIKSLWTGTSCISSVPGRLYHKPVNNCSREEFIAEVKAQILSCGALNDLIRQANSGKGLHEFTLLNVEVWHEWEFGRDGLKHPQPKWVTTTNTQAYIPAQKTPVANLFLAGAHTQTQAQVWSIEGAVESGRRAAKAIDDRVQVLEQYKPWWLRISAKIDDGLYALKAPHLIDSVFILVILFSLWQFFI